MTPLSKDNCWQRNIRPRLAKAGFGWVNFQVMRRTHATLMKALGVWMESSLRISSVTQSPVETRLGMVKTNSSKIC